MANMTTLPLDNPIILNVMDTYGTLTLGTVFSFALWGVACLQT